MGDRPKGSPCFLLAGDLVGHVPIMSPHLFGHLAQYIRYSVSIAEKVSNTLSISRKSANISPLGTDQMISKSFSVTFPNVSQPRTRHFL